MAPSLRKRIGKHSLNDRNQNTEAHDAASPLVAALEHLHLSNKTSKEDLTPTPPPPVYLTAPKPDQVTRRSPSKSLLDRYKRRAPAASAATMSNPDERSLRSRNKIAAFTEVFESSQDTTLPAETTREDAPPPPTKPTIRTVEGVDFEMIQSTQPSKTAHQRSRSADPPRSAIFEPDAGDSLHHPRTTRSQSRREQRSDSAVSENTEPVEGPSKTKSNSPSKAESTTDSPNITPRTRATLKKKTPDPPTPTRPRIPRATPTAGSQPSPRRNRLTRPKSTSSISDSNGSSSSSDSDAPTEHPLLSRDKQRAQPHRFLNPIKVLPPPINAHLLPGLVWASPLSGSSRPDVPWNWCKRWTCCRCDSETIVEQAVCSRLICGHARCGQRCRVMRDRRVATF